MNPDKLRLCTPSPKVFPHRPQNGEFIWSSEPE
jgi:hypothetical protein